MSENGKWVGKEIPISDYSMYTIYMYRNAWGKARRKYSNLLAPLENRLWLIFSPFICLYFLNNIQTCVISKKYSHHYLLVTRALQTAELRNLPGRRNWGRLVGEASGTQEAQAAGSWWPSAHKVCKFRQDPWSFSTAHLKPGAGRWPALCLSGAESRTGPPSGPGPPSHRSHLTMDGWLSHPHPHPYPGWAVPLPPVLCGVQKG